MKKLLLVILLVGAGFWYFNPGFIEISQTISHLTINQVHGVGKLIIAEEYFTAAETFTYDKYMTPANTWARSVEESLDFTGQSQIRIVKKAKASVGFDLTSLSENNIRRGTLADTLWVPRPQILSIEDLGIDSSQYSLSFWHGSMPLHQYIDSMGNGALRRHAEAEHLTRFQEAAIRADSIGEQSLGLIAGRPIVFRYY